MGIKLSERDVGVDSIPEFSVSFRYGGVSLSVTAKVEEHILLSISEPDRESKDWRHDVYCAVIARSAQQIAAQATQAHRVFLEALNHAALDDRRAYLTGSKRGD